MSNINGKPRGRQVSPPDIYPVSHHVGMPSPIGTRNRVEELAVEPFSIHSNGEWEGKDVFVLTLWTDDPKRSPFRLCFSSAGLEAMEEESRKARKLLE